MKHWLSTARWRNSSSQWAGPVVMLKAAGTKITFAPRRHMQRASSSNRRSKQTQSPMVPKPVARGEGVGLPEPLAALHVDVEQVGLPVLCQQAAVGTVDIAGVVDPLSRQLRHRAADDDDAQLRRQGGQGPLRLAALRLPVGTEAVVLIGTAEHLRQHGEVRAVPGGLPDPAAGGLDVLPPVCGHPHLDQCHAHGRTSLLISRGARECLPPL